MFKLGRFSLFKSEYSRFQLVNGLTFLAIYLLVLLVVVYNLYLIVDFNSSYIFAISGGSSFAGFSVEFKEAFFDYLVGNSISNLIPVAGVGIGLFFLGVYISNVLVRPFKFVSQYCENVLKNPQIEFEPDWLSGYRLFTRFAEIFFSQMNVKNIKNAADTEVYLPKYYAKIHKPITDWVFVVHFSLVMVIMTAISCYSIINFNDALYDALLRFVLEYSKVDSPATIQLLQYQNKLLYGMYFPVLVISVILNFMLAVYMYGKVSGAAFGVFSTMRSFLRGNYTTRIHLIGYNVLREYTRLINKYFDYLEGKLAPEKK